MTTPPDPTGADLPGWKVARIRDGIREFGYSDVTDDDVRAVMGALRTGRDLDEFGALGLLVESIAAQARP